MKPTSFCLLLGAAALGSGCADDVSSGSPFPFTSSGSGTGDVEGSDGGSTTTGVTSDPSETGSDPDTTDGTTTEGGTTGATSTDGETTDATTTDATSTGGTSAGDTSTGGGDVCGDDVADPSETCDGADLAGEDCVSQGFDAGELACAADCAAYDPTGCVMFSCGNDTIEGMEACDGSDLAGEDCLSQGFDAGVLACAAGCAAFDTSGCVAFSCGNDTIEGMEVCDGSDLAGEDCVSQGFDAGVLACAAGCAAFDTSGCVAFSCGNDTIEGMEVCDGFDLAGEDCISQGFGGGALGCLGDCSGFDTGSCFPASCEDEDIGNATGAAVSTGNTSGDDNDIDASCGAAGGNDRVVLFTAGADGEYTFDTAGSGYDTKLALYSDCGTEIACNDDGPGLGLQSELTLAMTAGQSVLVVIDGFNGATGDYILNITQPLPCVDEDIGGATGAAVSTGNTAADDNDIDATCGGIGGNDRVLAFTAPSAGEYVFDTVGSAYDTKLALYSDCDTEVACNDDGPGLGLQSELTAMLGAGQTVLLVIDGFNGATGDYTLNVNAGPPPLVCEDEPIGGAMGYAVSTGNTGADDNDLDPSCGGGGGNDRAITFIAPVSQDYSFDTVNSAFDTKLALYSDCATEVACNDDGPGLQSQLVTPLVAGEQVVVLVDGFGGATGDYQLNVFGGGCCTNNATPGCVDISCTDAICGADPFCCDTEWDGLCADAAALETACVGAGGCP